MKESLLKGVLAELKYFLNINNSIISELTTKYGISQNDYTVFYLISYNPGITQYDLSKFLKFTTQRLNQIVKLLVEEGYVDKIDSDGALLKKGLYITSKGEVALKEINSEIYRLMKDIFTEDELEDLEIINTLLVRVNKKLRERIK